jgi:hypothetical protein
MENVQQTANTVEFDVYIKNTGTTIASSGNAGCHDPQRRVHPYGFYDHLHCSYPACSYR